MNFSTPQRVADIITQLRDVDIQQRAPVRALIDNFYNGMQPFSDKEAEQNQIRLNVNFGEGADVLLQGRQQLETAMLSTGNFFSIRVPDAPLSKKNDIEGILTEEANKPLKKSNSYLHNQRQKFASCVLHGRGPQMWADEDDPIPFFVALPDLLIATDTDITLDNLNYFAVRRRMKPGQLWRKTFGKGKNMDEAWQLDQVRKILDKYKNQNQSYQNVDPYTQPERWAEVFKQNLLYWDSDVAPTIVFWDFYFSEDEAPYGEWKRGIILDSDCVPGQIGNAETPIAWVYEPRENYADKLSNILQVMFVDGNNVAPFMYHSCRGMGSRLYDTVMLLNRLRSQGLQKIFEDLVPWFQVTDPADRKRLDQFFVGLAYAVLPQGLVSVPKEQRPTIDPNLLEMGISALKQLVGEAGQQYTQDIDTGTKKERTAFEVQTMLSQVTKITSGMLNLAYLQESFADYEICRRLAKPDTCNFMAKRFQSAVLERFKEKGIGKKWLDASLWEVEHERVLGSGNSQLEMAQAQALFQAREAWSPEGQAIVSNQYAFAITHNPDLADSIAPRDNGTMVSGTVHDTELVFAAFMAGGAVKPRSGPNPIEVCNTMISLMEATEQSIAQGGNMATPQQIKGLSNAVKYTGFYLNFVAQDKSNQQAAKQFKDRLGKVVNEIKGYQQRLMQQAKSQQGNGHADPEAMAKLQMDQAAGQQKLAFKQQSHAQKMQQNQQKFAAQQSIEKAKALNQIGIESAKAVAMERSKPTKSPFDETSD